MNEKALRTLEYTKIIERLTELAGSSIGKELCRNLKPSSNLAEIEAAQKQTSDALSRIYQRGSISFSGVQDVRGSLKRLEIGGSLSALELLRIAKLLETTSRVNPLAGWKIPTGKKTPWTICLTASSPCEPLQRDLPLYPFRG